MNYSNFDFELRRKLFHSVALLFPLLYLGLEKKYMLIFLFVLALCVIYLDILRFFSDEVNNIINEYAGSLMRKFEQRDKGKDYFISQARTKTGSISWQAIINIMPNLSGASFMMFGLLITALLFSKGLAITAWLILVIADSVAALAGIKFGHANSYGKSMEGSIAFLVSSILIGILSSVLIGYQTSFIIILLSSLLTTMAEYYSKLLINDNLLIPLAYCTSTVILSFLFL